MRQVTTEQIDLRREAFEEAAILLEERSYEESDPETKQQYAKAAEQIRRLSEKWSSDAARSRM